MNVWPNTKHFITLLLYGCLLYYHFPTRLSDRRHAPCWDWLQYNLMKPHEGQQNNNYIHLNRILLQLEVFSFSCFFKFNNFLQKYIICEINTNLEVCKKYALYNTLNINTLQHTKQYSRTEQVRHKIMYLRKKNN